jgi:hypothetical protein
MAGYGDVFPAQAALAFDAIRMAAALVKIALHGF